ncbi:MAG: ATP-binding protein [Prevotellaceae bacterium]|jgi:predicted AAA+ superfamily ATPase|nr:ATP-binding protein [Prevotellaceae bacterium]
MYINRHIENQIAHAINNYPVTAVTGPRQCGKSTLAKQIMQNIPSSIYLDLERPSDFQKIENAEWYFSTQKNNLICIDEIQRKPDLFPLIRSLTDEWGGAGHFLILGSASQDLIKQSSESLAGRIVYKNLTPFLWTEIDSLYKIEHYLERGGFPQSILRTDTDISVEWRENFISTFLERDLLQWANFSSQTMRRLWQMLAHLNGQTVNYSLIASSLGVSSQTIKNYIDLLNGTFMIEVVLPYISNSGKRLVKAPKIYISDSGITAALLGLRNFDEMSGHPVFGFIWEQIVLSNLKGWYRNAEFFYYRTASGAEIDFVMRFRNRIIAIECKASFVPSLSKGNYNAIEDIAPDHTLIVTPATKSWSMKKGIDVVSLKNLEDIIAQKCIQ